MTQQLRRLATCIQERDLTPTSKDSSAAILKVLSTEKGRGSLREDLFLKIVGQYLPLSTDDQSRMALLCPKNLLGEVDIATTVARYLTDSKSAKRGAVPPPAPPMHSPLAPPLPLGGGVQ